jgi:hypothetical protein
MTLLFYLITAQSLMAGFDYIKNHIVTVKLSHRSGAKKELLTHSVAGLLFSVLLLMIAWWEWRGLWAWLILILVFSQIALTLLDRVVEFHSRRIPLSEEIIHSLLTFNYGAIVFGFLPITSSWLQQSSQVVPIALGLQSYFFTAYAIGACLFAAIDALAFMLSRDPLKEI